MTRARPGRPSQAATIRDVARAAGVSVATVSRALNDRGHVAEAVRLRVREAAETLHYAPHPGARDLSSRRAHTIAVVLPTLGGRGRAALVRGIDAVARGHGLHLWVAAHHGRADEQAALLAALRGRVDGVLLVPAGGAADAPIRADAPVVLLEAAGIGAQAGLGIDHFGGAVAMVRHLLGRGHRRIAFVAGPDDDAVAAARLAGYRAAMADVELPAWVLPGAFDEASGAAAVQALLAARPRPEAIFGGNDATALGALFALQRAGVRVPQDMALAGFDDVPLAACTHPALTTVRVDLAALGAAATRVLLDDPDAPHVPGGLLPAPLVVRQSCAGPAGWEI